MHVICDSCQTVYDGRDTSNGIEVFDPLKMEWCIDCPFCGCVTLIEEDYYWELVEAEEWSDLEDNGE